jgi:hypothetical protein
MIEAELPDGRILEFPDGTDHGIIQSVVKKTLGAAQQPATPDIPTGDVFKRSLARGAGLGFGEEAGAALAATFRGTDGLLGKRIPGETWKERYDNMLAALREQTLADREASPWTAYGSEAVGALPGLAVGLGLLPRAVTAGGRILQGAKVGAATGTVGGFGAGEGGFENRAGEAALGGTVGAGLGLAIPGAWEIAKAGGRLAKGLLSPFSNAERAAGRLAGDVAGPRRAAVINALSTARPIVPGSQPTAGQAAVPAGSSEFAALQGIVEATDPSRYSGVSGIGGQQEAARLAHLGTVARTPAALQAAKDARSATTTPMREAALTGASAVNSNTVVDQIDAILSQPGLRASDVVTKTLGDIKTKIGSLADKTGNIHAEDAYMIRKEVGNTIQKYAQETKSFDQRLTAGLQKDVQEFIDDAIEAGGGAGWRTYLQTYKDMSKPIDQMKVGKIIQEALTSSLGEAQRPRVFATAVRNAPQTMKKATGQSRYEKLSDVLTPKQEGAVQNVMSDLERNALFNRQAGEGRAAAGKFVSAAANPEGTKPRLLSRAASIIGNIVDRVEGKATKRTMAALSDLMADPKRMAEVMRRATPWERQQLAGMATNLIAIEAAAGVRAAGERTFNPEGR